MKLSLVSNPFKATTNVSLSLIILLATALRLYDLGTESYRIDEVFTAYLIPQNFQSFIQQTASQGRLVRNTVYNFSIYIWGQLFGTTEVALRSLSVLFGVISTGMIYLVGTKLFGKKAGLISAFLMAVSGFQIQHSQEARFYSLFVMLTLLSMYFYILAIKTSRTRFWIIHLFFNICMFYTHSYAVFVFAAEYLHYLAFWKRHKNTWGRWGISLVLLLLAMIPSFIPMLVEGKINPGLDWIEPPSLKNLLRTIYVYLFPLHYQHSWLFIGASFAAGFIFFILGGYIVNFRKDKSHWLIAIHDWFRNIRFFPRINHEFVLVSAWLVIPIFLPFIFSTFFTPIFSDRYTICAAPAYYLLIAIAISRIDRIVPISISLLALMFVILPGLQDYYLAPTNEQWREAAAYVQQNAKADDIVVYAPDEEGYQHKSLDWYYAGKLPDCGISSQAKTEQVIASSVSNCIAGHERFWVIMRGTEDVTNRMKSYFLNPKQSTWQVTKEHQFVEVLVYLIEIRK